MRIVDPLVCEIVRHIFGFADFLAAIAAVHYLWVRKFTQLLWLVPLALFCCYIDGALHRDVTSAALSAGARKANFHDWLQVSFIGWFVLVGFFYTVTKLAQWLNRRRGRADFA